jgi:hypothetical protein
MRFMLVLLLGGCAHHVMGGPALALDEQRPYEGIPAYLHCPAPAVIDVPRCPFEPAHLVAARETATDVNVGGTLQPSQPPLSKMERLERLRANLAAIDAHVASMGDQPTPEQLKILKLTVGELRGLLETWPDVLPEAQEMQQLVDRMETTRPIEQPLLRKRLNQLADLIRVQVVLAAD